LACFIIDDRVAVDAGSLAFGVNDVQRSNVRDVVLTHAHLDHVAGLPLFIDDLFATVESPIRVYAASQVIEVLERDIFNWEVYPRFSDLKNDYGSVVEYVQFEDGDEFTVEHLRFRAIAVDHKVPSFGFIVRDKKAAIAVSGDTTSTEEFWDVVNSDSSVRSVLIECAFPNGLAHIAERSYHMTPGLLERELKKLKREDCDIQIINIKPMYREQVITELNQLGIRRLSILEVGRPLYF
jgi:3',5'-cyclic-nucleotide phosphodiesterase